MLQLFIDLKKPGLNRVCVGGRQTLILTTAISGHGTGWKVGEWWERPIQLKKWFEKHESETIELLPFNSLEFDMEILPNGLSFIDRQTQTQYCPNANGTDDDCYIKKRLQFLKDLSRPISKIVQASNEYRSTPAFKAFQKELDSFATS